MDKILGSQSERVSSLVPEVVLSVLLRNGFVAVREMPLRSSDYQLLRMGMVSYSSRGDQTEDDEMMLDFGFYNLDCMEGMRQFPDKYFDLAIVDPPYGDGGGNGNERTNSDSAECSTNTARRVSRESLRSDVSRTGGTWAAKFGKKLFRGT